MPREDTRLRRFLIVDDGRLPRNAFRTVARLSMTPWVRDAQVKPCHCACGPYDSGACMLGRATTNALD